MKFNSIFLSKEKIMMPLNNNSRCDVMTSGLFNRQDESGADLFETKKCGVESNQTNIPPSSFGIAFGMNPDSRNS